MKSAIIVYPGSNCERETQRVLHVVSGCAPEMVWHRDTTLPDVDLVVIPGGFSYGDYLRAGAIGATSPIADAVRRHAERGGFVLGICNGFQVLCEMRLLPGVLIRNDTLKFASIVVNLKAVRTDTPFASCYANSPCFASPIAHFDGNYMADDDTVKRLEDSNGIAFRYVDAAGNATHEINPNGSINNIAGIYNASGNVLGLMPHLERHADPLLGNAAGVKMFQSLADHFA